MSSAHSTPTELVSGNAFSGSQQVALAVVPVVTGFLSLVGASCIVYIILRDPKRNQNLSKTYHRLLLGMSATDIIGSIRACTSSFVMPVGSWWMAAGNQGSCEFQGSAAQLAIGAALYSASLGIYFFLTIRNVNKTIIARRVEPALHLVSVLYPMATSVYGLINNIFNPVELGVGCWVSSYPTGCADDPNVECTRGQNAKVLIWIFAGIPVGLSLLIVVVSMISIFVIVRSTIRRMERRYSVVATQNQNRSGEFRIRQTALQAGLFIGAFIFTYLWTSVLRLVENDGKVTSSYFAIAMLSAFFYPLQGFFNFFIYVRPRYVELSRQNPRESKLDIVGRIFHRTPSSSRRKDASWGTTGTAGDEPSSRNFVSPSLHGSLSMGRRMSSWFLGRGSLLRQSVARADESGSAVPIEQARHPNDDVCDSLNKAELACAEDSNSSESSDEFNGLDLEGEGSSHVSTGADEEEPTAIRDEPSVVGREPALGGEGHGDRAGMDVTSCEALSEF